MDYTKLIEYQEKDNQLAKLNMDYFHSDEVSTLGKYKMVIDDSKKKIEVLESNSRQILDKYESLKNRIDELTTELNEFNAIIDSTATIQDADYYIKKINEVEQTLNELEKELSRDASSIDKINIDYRLCVENNNKAVEEAKKLDVVVKKLKDEIVEKGRPIQMEMKELEKEIDPELLNEYKQVKQSKAIKRFPYFILIKKSEEFCPKCGYYLSVDEKSHLKVSGDKVSCSNCKTNLIVE